MADKNFAILCSRLGRIMERMDYGACAGALSDTQQFEEANETVRSAFPSGVRLIHAQTSNASYWTRISRLNVALENGTETSLFLKVAEGANGLSMMRGEYESMKAIADFSSQFIPSPLAWGTFAADPKSHFMLSHYREMALEVPAMEKTCLALARLHLRSHAAGTRKFGFHVTTHNGSLAQDNRWCDSWESLFVQQLRGILRIQEEASQGFQSEELRDLLQQIFDKVIPRLLRPMETEGRSITPSLVHGDFWHGNVSTDINTGEPIMYDAGAFWGHNEYDIRTMAKHSRSKFLPAWQQEYLKHYPAAYPQEDFEARSQLYLFRSKIHDATLFPLDAKLRDMMVDHARYLVNAYREGYEGWLATRKGEKD